MRSAVLLIGVLFQMRALFVLLLLLLPVAVQAQNSTHTANQSIIIIASSVGVQSNRFGLAISGATNAVVVVEASTDLSNPTWIPVGTNTLTDGFAYFSDPNWTNYPARFYRVTSESADPPNPDPARLVWIPAGTFMMGSSSEEPARLEDEGPLTEVTISRGFWMGKYEVTQGEFLEVVGSNPSFFRNGRAAFGNGGPVTNELLHPVEQVTWFDATNYCALLTQLERAAGRLPEGYEYRLPTEAQWEYACRAGTTTAFCYGDALRSGMANFDGLYEYPPCGDDPYSCFNPRGIYLGRTAEVGSCYEFASCRDHRRRALHQTPWLRLAGFGTLTAATSLTREQ